MGWTINTDLPYGISSLRATSYNGKVYIVGGYGGSGYIDDLISYDPDTDNYDQSLNTMSIIRGESPAIGMKSGIIYVAGGYSVGGGTSSCEKYDIETDTWSDIASLPTAAYGLGGAIYGDYFYAFNSNEVYKYDINDGVSGSWTTLNTDAELVGYHPTVETIGDFIWVIGGSTDKRQVRKYNPSTDSWVSGSYTDAPSNVYCTASCAHGTKIYMAGAYQDQDKFKSYDTSDDSWDILTSIPTDRYTAAGAKVDNNFYVIGGTIGGSQPLKANESYELPDITPPTPPTNPGGDINPYKTRVRG